MYTLYIKSCPKKNTNNVSNILKHYTNYNYDVCKLFAETISNKQTVIIQVGMKDTKDEFISSLKKLNCKVDE
jgi:hypothetical protein